MALVHIAWMWSIAMDRNIGPLGIDGSTGELRSRVFYKAGQTLGGFHVMNGETMII